MTRYEDRIQHILREAGRLPVDDQATARALEATRHAIVASLAENNQHTSRPLSLWNAATAYVMKHRLSMATGAAIIIVLVYAISRTPPASVVMAQTVKAIQEANSYVLTETQFLVSNPNATRKAKQYWTAQGNFRRDDYRSGKEVVKSKISNRSAQSMDIDHERKVYFVRPPQSGHRSALLMIHKIARFLDEPDQKLGTREFGKRRALGFEIDIKKIDPDLNSGKARIWIDESTSLPLEVEYTLDTISDGQVTIRFQDIQWNAELDPALFEPRAPDGYSKRTQSILPLEDQVASICEALRAYADLMDGNYPQVTNIYPDVIGDEIGKKYGFDPFVAAVPDKFNRERVASAKILKGCGWVFHIFKETSDAAYYGKTVSPQDQDKVLLKWKLPDGKYQIIYGDLRHEIVTADGLHGIESAGSSQGSTTKAIPTESLVQRARPHQGSPRMPNFSFDSARACHWRHEAYDHRQELVAETQQPNTRFVEEGWFQPNVGLRVERRDSSGELTAIMVQNRRWRYTWNPKSNVVTVTDPSSPFPAGSLFSVMIWNRREVIEMAQARRATMQSEAVTRDGGTMEKIAFRYLADPRDDEFSPIHQFTPDLEELLASPDAKFRTRTYWFDPETKLITARACGCKVPKHAEWFDYPSSIPLELFTFQIPADATLRIEDRELGRVIVTDSVAQP